MEDHWIFILAVVLLGGAVGGGFYLSHQRTKAIRAIAPQLGFEFLGSGKTFVPAVAWKFALFSQGRSQNVENVVTGRMNGATIYLFDYSYRTGSGKKSNTHRHTVAFIQAENLRLPAFQLTPENFLHKVGHLFGHRDIDFENEPEFSKAYLLKGSDEDRVRQVFDYRVISFYNNQQRVCTEGLGNMVLYYVKRQYPVNQWRKFLAQAREAVDVFRASSHSV